jgi:hypothetical protein
LKSAAVQVVTALQAAGADAAKVENTWGADKTQAVAVMRQSFLADGAPAAFVVAGNPHAGWPDQVTYDGGHFVGVAGYDPVADAFTVLDPLADGPIQVGAEQLADYLRDGNAEAGELIRVSTPPPEPAAETPGRVPLEPDSGIGATRR